jgi:hypothetical protein
MQAVPEPELLCRGEALTLTVPLPVMQGEGEAVEEFAADRVGELSAELLREREAPAVREGETEV